MDVSGYEREKTLCEKERKNTLCNCMKTAPFDVSTLLSLLTESSDYNSVSMVLTFNADTPSQTVSIIITTDNIVENQEWFILSLNTTDSAVIPQSIFSTVSITDQTSEYLYACTHVHACMSITNKKNWLRLMPTSQTEQFSFLTWANCQTAC